MHISENCYPFTPLYPPPPPHPPPPQVPHPQPLPFLLNQDLALTFRENQSFISSSSWNDETLQISSYRTEIDLKIKSKKASLN